MFLELSPQIAHMRSLDYEPKLDMKKPAVHGLDFWLSLQLKLHGYIITKASRWSPPFTFQSSMLWTIPTIQVTLEYLMRLPSYPVQAYQTNRHSTDSLDDIVLPLVMKPMVCGFVFLLALPRFCPDHQHMNPPYPSVGSESS